MVLRIDDVPGPVHTPGGSTKETKHNLPDSLSPARPGLHASHSSSISGEAETASPLPKVWKG